MFLFWILNLHPLPQNSFFYHTWFDSKKINKFLEFSPQNPLIMINFAFPFKRKKKKKKWNHPAPLRRPKNRYIHRMMSESVFCVAKCHNTTTTLKDWNVGKNRKLKTFFLLFSFSMTLREINIYTNFKEINF